MSYSSLPRRSVKNAAGGLGLGWLLAFSVGGAILLFAAIGFLLTWRIKSRADRGSSTVYQVSDHSDDHRRSIFSRRLIKRKNTMSRSASRLSLSLPPVLPPLPSYNSFTFFSGNGKRGRSNSWVEEDKFHGPKVSRSRRDSLFSRDSWLGRAPTLPSLMMDDDPEKGQASEQQDEQGEQSTQAQKRHSGVDALKPSRTPPELLPTTQAQELPASPVRIPAQTHVRPSVTDSDLRDILRCTEQRLRDGTSRSPSKNSRASPQKIPSPLKMSPPKGSIHRLSPAKTPRTHRSASSEDSTGTVRISRLTPSPSKRSTIHAIPTKGHTRNASISSIGSAAQSLIAAATQELGLQGGLSSPSRVRNRQWEFQEIKNPRTKSPEEESSERRSSQESEASSSLSTLYSANEPEDKEQPDPFVEKKTPGELRSENRSSLFGPRALRSRTRTMSVSFPGQLAPINTQGLLRPSSVSTQAVGGTSLAIALQPPDYNLRDDRFTARDREGIALAFPVSNSMTSMVTPSVTTTDEDSSLPLDDRRSESSGSELARRIRQHPQDRSSLATGVPNSPTTTMTTSSPFDEQDMLSLLLGTAPRRALPEPPRHIAHVDQIAMPAPLSPLPRRDFSQQLRHMSVASGEASPHNEDSMVDDPSAISTGSPLRRSLSRPLRDPPALPPPAMASMGSLGNSILELRRMNSMISSYSSTSMASSSFNEPDSPTLPVLTSNFSRARTISNPRMSTASGRQNYLNMGSPKKNASGSVSVPPVPTRPLPPSRSSRSNLGVEIREDDIEDAKENGPELKMPRLEVATATGLRETQRSGNLGRDTRDSLLTTRTTGKTKLGAVSELVVVESRGVVQRQSAESIGLYDKDGFLKSSPPDMAGREAKGRCLRM
ncbi:hypothetical protein ACJ41O_010836 [Fusarium nematophilum]